MTAIFELALALALQTGPAPVNFSGKWVIEMPGRGGRTSPVILELNQVGREVTGTITPRGDWSSGSPLHTEIWDGQVTDGTLSFYVWVGRDRPVKTFYKGVLRGDDTIEFEVTGPASVGNVTVRQAQPEVRKVVARRTK